MGDTLAQDRFPMPEPFLGPHHFCLKLIEISSTKVLEFPPLEHIPHALLWIQFRCIARQALHMDAFGSACGQKNLDGLRAMNARPIPDDQQQALELAQEQLQEAHHVWALEGMIKESQIPFPNMLTRVLLRVGQDRFGLIQEAVSVLQGVPQRHRGLQAFGKKLVQLL